MSGLLAPSNSGTEQPRSQPKDSLQDQGLSAEQQTQNQSGSSGQQQAQGNHEQSKSFNNSQNQNQGKESVGITDMIANAFKATVLGDAVQSKDEKAQGENKEDQKSSQDQTKEKEKESGGITGWIADTVKETVSTLLTPITNVISPDANNDQTQQSQQPEQKAAASDDTQQQKQQQKTESTKNSQSQQQPQQSSENAHQEQRKESQSQPQKQPEQSKEVTKTSSQGQHKSQAKQSKIDLEGPIKDWIGEGRSVQLIFAGRCLAFHGKQIIVEEIAPTPSEQNTFNIELIKEEDNLVRFKINDLFLTADRNTGIILAPENSGKINSFHLERNGEKFCLRVHNEQKWVGVGKKLEKKDLTSQEQHCTELEKDGQIFVEKNKCFQFDNHQESLSDHICFTFGFGN